MSNLDKTKKDIHWLRESVEKRAIQLGKNGEVEAMCELAKVAKCLDDISYGIEAADPAADGLDRIREFVTASSEVNDHVFDKIIGIICDHGGRKPA